jgi:YegS/Rv2252/BmrU family lipid kinase
MRPFLVVNPHSANGQTGRKWPELEAHAGRILGNFRHAFTERPLHAQELARRALDDGHDCVVAVGGDGTLNEVVNGLLGAGATRSDVGVGVFPRGTGGDFRRTFGWEAGAQAAFVRLAEGRRQPLDVGHVAFTGNEGRATERYFANVCSFGASGQVVQQVTKGLGGKIGFFVATAKALAGYSDQKVKVSFDAGPWEALSLTTLAIANGRYFGGGMCVAPEADPADGLFDVTIWSGYSMVDFAVQAPKMYAGTHTKLAGTRTLRCRTLRAESDQEVLIDCDGEAAGRLALTAKVLPGALTLLG